MDARRRTPEPCRPAELPPQGAKRDGDSLIRQGRPPIREKEGSGPWVRVNAIPRGRIATQRLGGRDMERHEPGLAGLALDDAEDARLQVHVLTPQCQRLADTQPGGGQEPEQGDARMGARPATESAGST